MIETRRLDNSQTRYTYDAENQLISFSKPGVTATYAYDALGRRIQKNVNGTFTRYVYDNEDILEEYDASNTPRARYTHGLGIDEPLVMERDLDLNGTLETQVFYLQDGLGSVTALVDRSGNILERYEYDSFGNLTIKDSLGNSIPQSSFGNFYTYTGREYDPESGLYYYRNRNYNPQTGTFIQEDPVPGFLGIPESFNKYLYTYNNPVNLIDPMGLFSILPSGFRAFPPLPTDPQPGIDRLTCPIGPQEPQQDRAIPKEIKKKIIEIAFYILAVIFGVDPKKPKPPPDPLPDKRIERVIEPPKDPRGFSPPPGPIPPPS